MQISINGHLKEFEHDSLTVASLIALMNLTGKRIAIERNGEIVPRSQFEVVCLQSGDHLEIVGAVGGG